MKDDTPIAQIWFLFYGDNSKIIKTIQLNHQLTFSIVNCINAPIDDSNLNVDILEFDIENIKNSSNKISNADIDDIARQNNRKVCAAIRKNGTPCGATATISGPYCFYHKKQNSTSS